jgi:hypothetical protein
MTLPTVTENKIQPEPVVPDPFIDDVDLTLVATAAPPAPEPRRRRIWD